MKQKGFTLVELLAVLIILAVIALIAIPVVINLINNSKKSAAITGAQNYIRAVNNAVLDSMQIASEQAIEDGEYTTSELKQLGVEVEGTQPSGGYITITNSKVSKVEFLEIGDYILKLNTTTNEIEFTTPMPV